MTTQSIALRYRWMIRRDLPAVVGIERQTVAPWSEDDFLHCLRQRACIGVVAEIGDRVLGFMVYTLAEGVIRLENLAVRADVRRRGIGTGLVNRLKSRLQTNRRELAVLTLRETNVPAIGLFRSTGFRATGVSRGHYADTGEDGYRFVYRDPHFVAVVDDDLCGREVRR